MEIITRTHEEKIHENINILRAAAVGAYKDRDPGTVTVFEKYQMLATKSIP